jgi:oxygen-dependent protoporphyrinogen oxidase
MPEVVVVGGGISGLSAAYHLLRHAGDGVRVVVLEATSRVGGVISTDHEGGVTLEGGPDSILTRKPWGQALAEALGLAPLLITTRREARGAMIWWRGRQIPIPAGMQAGVPTDLSALRETPLLSAWGKYRAQWDLWLPPTRVVGDVSLGRFLAARFGREVVDRLAAPMLSGIYAGDVWELSLEMTAPQLAPALQRSGSLMRGLAQGQPSARPAGPLFRTLDSGLGTLVDAAATAIRSLGGTIRLDTPVAAVRSMGDRWAIQTQEGEVMADAVILALPAWAAATLLTPVAPAAAGPLAAIPYANLAVAGLIYESGAVAVPRDKTGVLVPRQPGIELTALTYLASKWDYQTPPDAEPIRAFYGRAGGRDVLSQDDAGLLEQAERDVARILGSGGRPRYRRLFRHRRAMPQYLVGHRARVLAVDHELERVRGLEVAGNWRQGVGIPDCVREGEAAASRTLRTLGLTEDA